MNERMRDQRRPTLAPLTGVVIVVFFLLGFVITGSAGYP